MSRQVTDDKKAMTARNNPTTAVKIPIQEPLHRSAPHTPGNPESGPGAIRSAIVSTLWRQLHQDFDALREENES
jgi:hypothetical protein